MIRNRTLAAIRLFLQRTTRRGLATVAAEGQFDPKQIITRTSGEKGTLSYRRHFYRQLASSKQDILISPWHDIPLYISKHNDPHQVLLAFITEIPRGSNAKMEMATDEPWNPIKQDSKNGQPRVLKHGPVLHNYGFLPQTWEDPNKNHPDTELAGDDDPIDALELSTAVPASEGAILTVKPLGALALIDEGETDWKILTINVEDPLSHKLNDVQDVEKHMPGTISAIREWYRMYKVAEGKKPNAYALGERAMDSKYALSVIADTHKSWKDLTLGRAKKKDAALDSYMRGKPLDTD